MVAVRRLFSVAMPAANVVSLAPILPLLLLLLLLLSNSVVMAQPSKSNQAKVNAAAGKSKALDTSESKDIFRTGPGSTTGTAAIKDKWALVIGISNFAHPEYNLKYAAKDAEDFKSFLIKECNFAPDHVKFLKNESATRGAIMDAFGDNWLPRVVMPGDLVVIYISTHGTPATRDASGRNYIVAYDTDRDKLYSEGVEMNSLNSEIKTRVKAERVLIVMDTCYSGATVSGARGAEAPANFDAKQIAQGTGHLVLTSSAPNERSWEGKEYANGLFTHNLINALRKNQGKIDVQTAFADVQKTVAWEAQSNFGASQTPSMGGKWEGVHLVLSTPPSEPRSLPWSMKDIPNTFKDYPLGNLAPTALSEMGIASITASKGEPGLFARGSEMVLPEGCDRVLLIGNCGLTSELDIKLEHPATSFSITRIGVVNGSSMPKWRMEGYNAAGQVVGTTGESNFSFDQQPRTFTVSGTSAITQVKLFYDNRMNETSPWATYSTLPIAKFEHTH